MRRKYGHTPIVPPYGSSDNVRNLVQQLNALFDDVYSQIGKIREDLKEVQQGDEPDVNEDNEL